jgi:hypothetical protein
LPFRGGSLALVVTFTMGLLLARRAGWIGLPLGFLLTSWFFKYCFILLDAVVAGAEEPPVLSVEMVNPVDEQRPLAQAVLILGGAFLSFWVGRHTTVVCGWALGAVLLLLLPASIAVLGLSSNVARAAWPPELLGVVRGVGRDYLVPLGGIVAVAAASVGFVRWDMPTWLAVAATQLGLLVVFALVGGVLHEHRLALGIEFKSARERLEERSEREHVVERNRMLETAHRKFAVGKPVEGWQEIETWLKSKGAASDPTDKLLLEHRAVLAAVLRWDDARPGDRLTDELITLFFARRETGRALEVVAERLESNAHYRPREPTLGKRLAELAAAAGKRSLRRQLAPDEP